ncbi:MAG: penicillin-binding protein 2 [Verrucomicrobiia bacterium]
MRHGDPPPTSHGRILLMAVIVFLATGLLIWRLFQVQIAEGETHAERLRNQTTVRTILSPARGAILDRNGIALAENRASIDIDINFRELVGNFSRNVGRTPKTEIVRVRRGEEIREKKIDVVRIVHESTAPMVTTLGFALPDDRTLRRAFDQRPNVPFSIAKNIDFETLSRFAEHNFNIPGISEHPRPIRHYNYGALAAHVLGYIGQVEVRTDDAFTPESVGKTGIEFSFDSFLQGQPGFRILRRNKDGHLLRVEAEVPPSIGHTLYLTLDARIQMIAEQAMRKVGRGAAVITDPRNGDILALVSVPSFDPNVFVPSVPPATWRELTNDPTKPLLNRALSGYAAGSTFKTIVALAALDNPKINFTPATRINAPAGIQFGNHFFRDWSGSSRGPITLHTALEWSSNTFFYYLGARVTGIESIVETSHLLGFAQRQLTYDPPRAFLYGESPGVIPGPHTMEANNRAKIARWEEARAADPNFKRPRPWLERWTDGHSANVSVGQGDVLVTPLQMTTMIAAIANGGTVFFPRLVAAITRPTPGGGIEVVTEFPERLHARLPTSPADLDAVRKALRAVVVSGTGKSANVKDFDVAGKTGTAQFTGFILGRPRKDLRCWFNGYAPADNPRYAITVMVEGGTSGGATAGPIVREIFENISRMERGEPIDMPYLTPAIGNFAGATEPTATPATPTEGTANAPIAPDPAPSPAQPERRRGSIFDIFRRR